MSEADDRRATGDGSGTESAARVADILLLYGQGPSALGVSMISRELGLSKAVVHRILQSLTSRRLLTLDPATRKYELGPAVVALGARALRESQLRAVVRPLLRDLAVRTGETATLTQLVGDWRVYIDQVESTQEIKMTVELGRTYPLHAGASGRAMLAFLDPVARDAILKRPLARLTASTIVDPDDLRRRLEAVAKDGVAVSRGEREVGAGAIAAPVFGMDGLVVGAISVCGPAYRLDSASVNSYKELVKSAAHAASQALGSPDHQTARPARHPRPRQRQ